MNEPVEHDVTVEAFPGTVLVNIEVPGTDSIKIYLAPEEAANFAQALLDASVHAGGNAKH